jgi:uncharacterized protein
MGHSPIDRIRRTLGGQTSLDGALDAMGKEREEQVLARILGFTDLVVTMVDKLADMFHHYTAGDFEACKRAAAELDQLESDADDHKLEISDRLSTGGVFSMGRADLARLVTSVDRIANLAAGAADRLVLRPFTLPPEFNAMLIEMVHIDVEAVRRLRDSIYAMRGDPRQSIQIAREIDGIESRADAVFARMYRFMFDMEIDFKTFHQLKAIIERLETISDKCAENGDLLRHLALGYLDY